LLKKEYRAHGQALTFHILQNEVTPEVTPELLVSGPARLCDCPKLLGRNKFASSTKKREMQIARGSYPLDSGDHNISGTWPLFIPHMLYLPE
jgi:hypothetical protein